MTDEMWENGLREVMSGTADRARVMAPPTEVILRKGRSSLRRRNGLAGSGALGVVAAAVVVGMTLGTGSVQHPIAGSGSTTLPQTADAVITVGPMTAKTKVVLYEDYRCPVCKDVDEGISATLDKAAAAGTIQVEYRPTNLIDRNHPSGGNGSVVAGNAVHCAADHGDFAAYRTAVYANQPLESDDTFQSKQQLIALARAIPGLDTPAFEKCVDDMPYASAISRNYDTAMNTEHCGGMPCLIVDGQKWSSEGVLTHDVGAAMNTWLTGKIEAS